ncbi:MAG TPA: hypothetical protein VLK84_13045 [Longimicrobium sp.]|nr:hypothetical protein [Longimicrobium sp.]
MRHSARSAVRGVFGALVMAGLGFGAGQAFAAPSAAAETAGACLKDDAAACNANCRETYGLGWAGQCFRDAYGNVSCGCRQLIVP